MTDNKHKYTQKNNVKLIYTIDIEELEEAMTKQYICNLHF